MPSRQKTLLFSTGFIASIGSFAIICTCLATTEWVSSDVYFKAKNHSGYASVKYGLFQGTHAKFVTDGPGLGIPQSSFQVLQELSGSAKVIHIIVILFLVLSLFCSFFSSATTCLNSVSNPYVTFLGPIGVYVWASVNGFFILLVMILCASNTEVIGMPKKLAIALDSRGDEFLESRNTYGYSFWILTLSILLNVATIIVIYFYQHTRYSRKKEQERPMENASKDVILF